MAKQHEGTDGRLRINVSAEQLVQGPYFSRKLVENVLTPSSVVCRSKDCKKEGKRAMIKVSRPVS